METHRNAPAIVLHGNAVIPVNNHGYSVTPPFESLIHTIIDEFVDEMVQPFGTRISDIHGRHFTYRIQTIQNLYVSRAIFTHTIYTRIGMTIFLYCSSSSPSKRTAP